MAKRTDRSTQGRLIILALGRGVVGAKGRYGNQNG